MADFSGLRKWCFCTPPHESHSPHRLGEGTCIHKEQPDTRLSQLIIDTRRWLETEGVTQPAAMALLKRWIGTVGHA